MLKAGLAVLRSCLPCGATASRGRGGAAAAAPAGAAAAGVAAPARGAGARSPREATRAESPAPRRGRLPGDRGAASSGVPDAPASPASRRPGTVQRDDAAALPASHRAQPGGAPGSARSSREDRWGEVLGLQAPWLDLERISHDCVMLRNAIPALRTALETFRQAVEGRQAELADPVTHRVAPAVERARADAMSLYLEAVALVDAHDALQVPEAEIPAVGVSWVLGRDDALVDASLRQSRDGFDAGIDRLRSSGVDVDAPAFKRARAAYLQLHEQGVSQLQAHRALGLRVPWTPPELRLRCATLEGVADMRRRCRRFAEQVDAQEQRCREAADPLAPELDMALRTCKAVCDDTLSAIRLHEEDIRAARICEAATVADIPPPAPGTPAPTIGFDTRFAGVVPMYVLDEEQAGRRAEETVADLDRLYRAGHKSGNKANLRKGFDAAVDRLNRLIELPRRHEGAPRETMEAARRSRWHNCTDLVNAGSAYLLNRRPPVATAHIGIHLPADASHRIGVINAAHHLPLDKDMTRWPADVWVFDRWTGNRAVRARDYPQYFLDQMRKWHAAGKLVASDPRHVGCVVFSHWRSPLDTRWVEGVVNALRDLPQVPPPPADWLEPWPGSRPASSDRADAAPGVAPQDPGEERPAAGA